MSEWPAGDDPARSAAAMPPSATPSSPRPGKARKKAPRWLSVTGAIALIGIAALLIGGVGGWVARNGFVASEGTPSETADVQATDGSQPDPLAPMPDVRGLTEADARQVIADAGYPADIISVVSTPSLLPVGSIAAQSPVQGTVNPKTIVLSIPAPATMPDLVGEAMEAATESLARMGADPKIVRIYDAKATPGTVLSTEPVKGAPLNSTPIINVVAIPATAALSALPVKGNCRATSDGSVNGVPVSTGLLCRASTEASTSYWILGRTLARVQGTIGLEDNSDPAAKATVTITADGKTVFSKEFAYGQSEQIDLALTNVLRLELTVTDKTGGQSSSESQRIVWADATVLGSSEAISKLEVKS